MRQEIDLIRASREVPMDADLETRRKVTVPLRKELREVTDALLDAIRAGSGLVPVVSMAVASVLVVADMLDKVDEEPNVEDLMHAVGAVLVSGRNALDRGLTIGDWPTVRMSAVSVELLVRGLMSALGVPYDQALAAAYTEGEDGIEQLLLTLGKIQPKENDNDDGQEARNTASDVGCAGDASDGGDRPASDGEVGLTGSGGDGGGD
jgi:hypothetical protein